MEIFTGLAAASATTNGSTGFAFESVEELLPDTYQVFKLLEFFYF